jgi:hypothetical protein
MSQLTCTVKAVLPTPPSPRTVTLNNILGLTYAKISSKPKRDQVVKWTNHSGLLSFPLSRPIPLITIRDLGST